MRAVESRHAGRAAWASVTRVALAAIAVGAVISLVATPDVSGGASSHARKGLVISSEKNATFGTILVSGTPVYTLKSSGTPCAAQCLKYWPAVVLPKGVARATAGSGVDAAKLGTLKRAGGELQVTYAGKALYRYVGDKSANQVNGNITDTWGTWTVVVTVKPSAGGGATTTTTSPGGGGVGF